MKQFYEAYKNYSSLSSAERNSPHIHVTKNQVMLVSKPHHTGNEKPSHAELVSAPHHTGNTLIGSPSPDYLSLADSAREVPDPRTCRISMMK